MKRIVLFFGSLYGGLSVLFGAFGAHALKSILTEMQLASFETAVRYEIIHALVLLIIGYHLVFKNRLQIILSWFFIIGVLLFSGSIFLLSTVSMHHFPVNFLWPVTPLGGLLLIIGWLLLLINSLKK